jgi:transketolase
MGYCESVTKREIAISARRIALNTLSKSESPHLGSALSSIDYLVHLYVEHLGESDQINNYNRLVFSKGHAGIACYSVMAALGIISTKEIESYCKDGSLFYGHISHLAHSSIELSTGSLGHGLPFGIGLAHGKKLKGEKGIVFTVLSDGEMNEGTTWESALLARKLQLNNLVCLIDRNRLQSLEDTESTLPLEPLEQKWNSFGWATSTLNGHSFESLANIEPNFDRPSLYILETKKGKGVPWMEDDIRWHYKWPDATELKRALKDLE